MRIFLVTSQRPFEIFYGGEQKFVISLGHWLEYKGYQVILFGRTLFRVRKSLPSQIVDSARYARNVNQSPKSIELPYPIAVLCMLFISFLLFLKIFENCRTKGHVIVHVHDAYAGLAGLLTSKILKLPIIVHLHGLRSNTMMHALSRGWRFMLFYERLLENLSIRNADAIIIVNQIGKKHLVNMGVKSEKIYVIPVGIETSAFKNECKERKFIRKELGLRDRDIVLAFIGRFSPEKNLVTLLSAFEVMVKQRHNVKLVLIGTGPLESKLRAFCYVKGIEKNVIFAGVRYDVNRLLPAFDILILPSYVEGSPTSLLEGMAAGRAIIASNIPAIREIVENGKEALLFDPSSPRQLEDAILKLYYNPGLRKQLGENAKKKAKQFDVNLVYKKILEVYREISKAKFSQNVI